jgi:MSHA biogenesis protein MshK
MAGCLMRYTVLVLTVTFMAAASTAFAQALRDPTRPPIASKRGVMDVPEQSGWILQSVLISPERRYAIINGEIVALGGSVAGAELVAVAAERVTLRTPDGLRVVQLFPNVIRLEPGEGSATEKLMTSPEVKKGTKAQRSKSSGTKR